METIFKMNRKILYEYMWCCKGCKLLDAVDMREDAGTLLKMCDDLLGLFSWPEYSGSDIKFMKFSAYGILGKIKGAVTFCEKWVKKEPENILAATAGVYAYIDIKEYDKTTKLVERFIFDKSECFEENDIMFRQLSNCMVPWARRRKRNR